MKRLHYTEKAKKGIKTFHLHRQILSSNEFYEHHSVIHQRRAGEITQM